MSTYLKLYERIGPYYSSLFPLSNDKVRFLENIASVGKRILDVGSADGTLVFALAQKGFSVTGIDTDQGMIEKAIASSRDSKDKVRFLHKGMGDLESFGADAFDLISCMGNTLLHLESLHEITQFLNSAATILSAKGRLVIQIMHVEGLLDEAGHYEFPDIETPDCIFKRTYQSISADHVEFNTTLVEKRENYVSHDTTMLFKLSPKALVQLIKNSPFQKVSLYKDYSLLPFTEKDPVLLALCEK